MATRIRRTGVRDMAASNFIMYGAVAAVGLILCTVIIDSMLKSQVVELRPRVPPRHVGECGPDPVPRNLFIKSRTGTPSHFVASNIAHAKANGFTVYIFDDAAAAKFVEQECSDAWEAYKCLVPGSYKADVFRFCALKAKGGVYMDDDLAMLVDLLDVYNESCGAVQLFNSYSHSLGLKRLPQTSRTILETAVMASPKGDGMWQCCIDEVVANVNARFYGTDALDVTGPTVLSNCGALHDVRTIGFFEWPHAYSYHTQHRLLFLEVDSEIKGELNKHYTEYWRDREVYDEIRCASTSLTLT